MNTNPFVTEYTTPHSTVPFHRISIADYKPAILKGIEEEDAEIEAICSNPEPPTFANTIIALEKTGDLLHRTTSVFYNMLSAETCDELEQLSEEVSPLLSEHGNNITLNMRLFQRINTVYEENAANGFSALDSEEKRLLITTYRSFTRNGAKLSDEDKQTLRDITTQLSLLTLRFSQNKLKATNAFMLHITSEAKLEGLPQGIIDAARQEAISRNLEGWVFTLHAPSYGPFMQYSAREELRKQMYMAYNTICTEGTEYDNSDICRQLVNLRLQYAQLLGYHTYADYVLENRMAETPKRVQYFLHDLIAQYMPACREELAKLNDGKEIMPWNFAYISNNVKRKLFNIDSEMLRPYFELSRVKEGIFGLATRLYGITFRHNADIPVYHKDVEAYDVFDQNGDFLAVFYCDFFPRESKKSGAWMTSFTEQYIDEDGVNHRPHVSIVANLTKPTPERPSLLTLGEVETFLHEFGHSLHGIFANTRFQSLSGTNVYWDFVELPSQFMENYSIEPEFLATFARHYQTGEPMPAELTDRIIASRNFNVAYACMRQVSFGLLDMAYYTIDTPLPSDGTFSIKAFEQQAWQAAQVLPQIDGTCMTVQFGHIMSGGYSAGYYSYKWAEVLDADAFATFKRNGIFDKATAQSFRDNVLSQGNTLPPMELYTRFSGHEPTIDALLERNGICRK